MEFTVLKLISVVSIFTRMFSKVFLYELECPSNHDWRLRATSFCQSVKLTNYSCLFNASSGLNVENCQKPEGIGKGNKIIWKPDLIAVECSADRFQPFNFWTNKNNDCYYRKSICSEEGQVLTDNGSSIIDLECRCDYTRGYTYVTMPSNICACKPTEEDCSCYKANCSLSQDYNCLTDSQRNKPASTNCKAIVLVPISQSDQKEPSLQVIRNHNRIVEKELMTTNYPSYARIPVTILIILYILLCILGYTFEPFVTRNVIKVKDYFSNRCSYLGNVHRRLMNTTDKDIEIDDPEETQVMNVQSNHDESPMPLQNANAKKTDDADDTKVINAQFNDNDLKSPSESENIEETIEFDETQVEDDQFKDHALQSSSKKKTICVQPSDTEITEPEEKKTHADPLETITVQTSDNVTIEYSRLKISGTTKPFTPRQDSDEMIPVSNGLQDSEQHNLGNPSEENIRPTAKEWQHYTRIENMSERHEKFYESNAFFKIWETLQNIVLLAIIGASGDGKTWIAEHCALKLAKLGFEIIPVSTAEELDNELDVRKKQVFILNDPFGKQNLNEDSRSSWVQYSAKIKDDLCAEKTKIFTTIRKSLYQAYETKLKETILTENVFDLSEPGNQMSFEEKKEVLSKHVHDEDLRNKINKEIKDYVPGFPLWCQSIGIAHKNRKGDMDLNEQMFNPAWIFMKHMKDMKHDNIHQYCCLVLAAIEDGSFDINTLNTLRSDTNTQGEEKILKIIRSCGLDYSDPECLTNLKEGFNALKGVYFNLDKPVYRISHDAIIGAVAHVYGWENQDIILKYCSSSFLREYVRTCNAPGVNDLGICIKIKSLEYYELFAKRFVDEIKNNNAIDMFLNPSEEDPELRRQLYLKLNEMNNCELTQIMSSLSVNKKTLDLGVIVKFTKFALDTAILTSSPFHWLCKLGHIETVQHILATCKDKEMFLDCLPGHTTPLHFAAGGGHLAVVKELVKAGADVNVKSTLKLQSSKDIGEYYTGFTPLLYAARQNHPEVVRFLLQEGADPNLVRDHGGSPMLLAADRGHAAVVKILLEHKGDPNIHCDHGTTPIILAAQDGHVDTVRILEEWGAELNRRKFENNISALFAAAKRGRFKCVKFLVEKKATIDLPGTDDSTPLLAALENNHFDIAKFLIQHGADINRANKDNLTPKTIAKQKGVDIEMSLH